MKNQKFNFTIAGWQTLKQQVEYTTKIFDLLKREMFYQEEGLRGSFFMLRSADWINVVALTRDNDIVLVEQYRYGIEEPTLELAGGMVDAGEDPLTAAKRELLEETGYWSDDWENLGKVSSNPAIQTNFTHTFLAKDCVFKKQQDLGEHEFIKVHVLPLQEFLELTRQGLVHHALVVAAMAKYLLHVRQ